MFRSAPIASLMICIALIAVGELPAQDSLRSDVATMLKVGPAGAGHQAAREAADRLSRLPAAQIGVILGAFGDASPLVKNWLRVVASSVAENGEFPKQELLAFFADRSRDPDARHLVFQLLVANDPQSLAMLMEGAQTDPSLPVRHLAISRMLDRAAAQQEGKENDAAIASYREVLAEGRNPNQLKAAANALEKLGVKVDLAEELGMIRRWWAMGTYDNQDSKHFATSYLPETLYVAEGRLPPAWLAEKASIRKADESDNAPQVAHLVTSDDPLGMVDLNPTFAKAKDAVVYAYGEFDLPPDFFRGESSASQAGQRVQARLGCITANKVWVNGKPVLSNEVYHSGTRIDQYVGECSLVPGRNTVLIKVLQNAQTEPWAQDWQFQFRFTDLTGAGLPIFPTTPAP
jgi:hypothetical protein